jgi:hypothetical protein
MSEMEPNIKSIKIISQDGSSECVYGEQVSIDTYRLLENSILTCKINYGTIVKVITDENGDLVSSKLVRASDYKTRKFLISSSQNIANVEGKILDKIEQAGRT